MSRTSTDSYRKRLFAAFLMTFALYCIAGGAFVLLPKVALCLSSGGSGGGSGVLFLGTVPGSGAGDPGEADGTGEADGSNREISPQATNPAARQIAASDNEALAAESIATTGGNSSPGESDNLAASVPSGTDGAVGTGGPGGPGYGGGNGSGGSFVDAMGDATTAPFISWIDRSIRKRLYYPEKARLRNLEGTVTLGMAVPADGSRCEVVLAKSSGHEILDHAAIGLVRSLFPAKVAPGRDFSAPVRIRYTLVDN